MKSETPETDAAFPLSTNWHFPDTPEYLQQRAVAEKLERERNEIRAAIRNLRDVEGRHHSQIACERLFALLPENAKEQQPERSAEDA